MSFESFSHSLAYMLISELGGTEIPAMQTDILPAHRIVSLQQCTCIIAQGEGLTEDQIKGQSEMLLEAVKKGSFPSKSGSVCVIYVFEQPCPAILKKKITSLAKRPPVSLSNRAVFGGYADLSDGSAGTNGDYTISAVASLLKKTVKLFQKGELRIEDGDNYRAALEKLEKQHIDFAMRLSDTTPWATYALTGICILMFIWESVIGGSDNSMVLLRMGATSSTLVMGGEWWRLVGSMFLHIGIIHLIVNMYALISVGSVLERYLGNIKFLALYAISGVAGSAASAFMGTQIGAGASGAIFGLFGAAALIGWRYRNEIPTAFRNQLAGGMAVTIIYNLLYGFGHQGIDNSAHIGGLVAGLIFAAVIPPEVTGSGKGRSLSGAQTTLFIFIALCMFATQALVIYRAVIYRDFSSYRSVEYYDAKNECSYLYPEVLKMKDADNATLLLFPGMIFQVLSVSEAKPVIIDESQRDALVQDLSKEIAMKVDKSSIESINGRMWLIIEGSKNFKGSEAKARVTITSADGKMYLVYAFASDKFFAEAVTVSKGLVSSIKILKKP